MKVVSIESEPHGYLALAKDGEAARQWLIDTEWITEHSELWIEEEEKWYSLAELYGEEWMDKVLSFTDEQMEDLGFYLSWEEVFG